MMLKFSITCSLEVFPLMLGHKNLAWAAQVLFHVAKQAPQWVLTQEWAIAWDIIA